MTAVSSARLRPSLVVEAKHDAAAVHEGEHLFDEAKHPRDKHGRFISIGAHIDLGNGVTGEVLAIGGSGAVTVAKDGGGAVTVRGDQLRHATVAHTPGAPAAPKAPEIDTSPKVTGKGPATPEQVRSYLRDGLPEYGDNLAWHRIDTGEPQAEKDARLAAVKAAKVEVVADMSKRLGGLSDGDLLGEADAKVIARVRDGKTTYLRKPRLFIAGDKKGQPIPGMWNYIEMDRARYDSMVAEHGLPTGGTEVVDIEAYRDEKRRDAIGNLVDLWANASNDSSERALAMQEIANDIFGLQNTADWPPAQFMREEIDRVKSEKGTAFEAFLRAEYAATQEKLAAAGITEVPIHRGIKLPARNLPDWVESGDVPLRPMSSFSADGSVAATFGFAEADYTKGYLMTGTVPASRIISTPRTGSGCLEEGEFIVLGGPGDWTITPISMNDVPVSQITTRVDMQNAIAVADTPERRVALAVRAQRVGLGALIPTEWQWQAESKVAQPQVPAVWPNDLNEDWLKTLVWHVRTPDGNPVESLDALMQITGDTDRQVAARKLIDGPSAAVAPPALVHEARDALGSDAVKPRGLSEADLWPNQGRKTVPDGTVRAVGTTGRSRPHLAVEDKAVTRFDPMKHPRDDHGRWAHVPGGHAVGEALRAIPRQGRQDGKGTADDPIEVGDDLSRAAQLLGEGKHVRLSQPEQVATLLDKLREVVEDARAKGERAPNYDLCKVSVPGTNLFCKQSKGIPRAKMPQLGGAVMPGTPAERVAKPNGRADITPQFRDALAAMGIPVERRTMPASHLRASQAELDGVKVAEMAAAMEAGRIREATIFVSRDGYVIDGHHRWAAKVAIDTRDNRVGDVMMEVEMIDLDIGAAIDYANAFANVMGIAPKAMGQKAIGEGKRARPYLVVDDTLTVMWTAYDVLARVMEEKGIRGRWEAAKHPRDKHGRFISIGEHLDLGNGQSGQVTHLGHGSVTIKQDDGKSVTVRGGALKNATTHVSKPGTPGNLSAPGAARQPGRILDPNRPTTPIPLEGDRVPPVAGSPLGDSPASAATAGGPPKPLTDMQYEQHTAQIEAAAKKALDDGLATDHQYSLDGKGQVWAPERAKQHKEIVDALWAQAVGVPSDGKALIAGGLGGAGKGTVLGKYANIPQGQFLTVNPDDVKELMAERGMVPKVPGLSSMEASTLIHEESSHVANMLAQRAYAERKNMIWDITMSSKGSVQRRIAEMRGAGYTHIEAVFVDIPVETSVQRALGRHRRGMEQHRAGQGPGGRYVPPSVIRQNSHEKWSSANRGVFEDLKGQFDGWQIWDTSAAGTAPKKVATSGKSMTESNRRIMAYMRGGAAA